MNLDVIAEQLFNAVKSRYSNLVIGDEKGDVTNVPKEARFFDFDFGSKDKPIGKVSVSLDEQNGIVIIYNADMIDENYGLNKNDWFGFLKDMRQFSKKRLLKFEVRDVTRSNLEKRDYKFLATNRPGDNTMSESKMYGTNKTSFQKFGSAKLSIKHNGTIDEGESRNKKIGSIFIETSEGEKFRYPYKHLSGARALATHVSEGGHMYDDFGKYITGLSEELSKLRKFNQYINRSSVMAETLSKYSGSVKERMTFIKKEIANLQKPNYYKTAFESYEAPMMEEVPNDVAENWIDQLTIKQFNEELKDVFPYIYNLVSESTLAEEITPEDLIGEQADTNHTVKPGETIASIAQQYADHFPNGVDEGIEEIIDANGIADPRKLQIGQQLVIPRVGAPAKQIGASPDNPGSTRGIDPRDNYSPEDLKRLVNQPGYSESIEEQFEQALDSLLGQFSEGYMRGYSKYHCKDCGCQMHNCRPDCNCKHDSHDETGSWWRDANGNGVPDIIENEGNAYAHAVRKAKMAGKKKGDKVDHPDPDEDDIVIEKEKTPLGEFILSYFDKEQGTFPKGPTAVLTMVEKEYGEQFVRPAKEFIERIDAKVAEVMGYKEGVKTPGDSHYNKERAIELLKKKGIMNPTYGELMAAIKKIEMGEGKSEGDAYYIMTHAKKLAADDGLDPFNLSYGTLTDYIKKAKKLRGIDEGDSEVDESGLQRHIGIKKYGKKGFEELQKAGREGASEEEKGAIKDKYISKESEDIMRLAGLT